MSGGFGSEATHEAGSHDARLEEMASPSSGPGLGVHSLQQVLAQGQPDVHEVARILSAHPHDHDEMLGLLHTTVGNGFVQSVMSVLARGQGANPAAQTSLGFGGSLGGPRVPTSRLPLTSEADLKARADRSTAEGLLKSKEFESGEQARQAMEILLEIPESHRGKAIDALDDKAFENLLERVPDDQRERFAKLVEASKKPERKLLLWAEAHKSRADNDLRNRKGDIGKDVPTTVQKDEDGELVNETDPVEREQIEESRTPGQRTNRKRHERRTEAVESTKEEVDIETKRLMAKAKHGKLTLADVDAMRGRKDLEYQIELENNLNLTADSKPYENGDPVVWKESELELVRTTLARLPHVRDPDAFKQLHRMKSPHFMDGRGGELVGDRIEITDRGVQKDPGFRHGGDEREGVSDEFCREHGDKVNALEFLLTHEIGHDVGRAHPDAFNKFQKAAGWKRVKVDALREDNVSVEDLAYLEQYRDYPHGMEKTVAGTTTTYSPIKGSDEFWASPKTAIPSARESAPGPVKEYPDTWQYARVAPNEHFAEIYAKAVHVPETLYDELIVRPGTKAQEARAKVDDMQRKIDALQAAPNSAARLASMTKELEKLKASAMRAERAELQRGEEFRIMRSDVFGTDKAIAVAVERLKTKQVSAKVLGEFERRAARVSTPEQVAVLEREAST